jgi:16S rRNA (adenine1518-N6/adenine1519-N6)-dimethyltransferase
MGLIVTTAFSHRRKTLRNALASVINVDDIEDAGIDPGLRPENLSFADYRRLAHLGRLPRSRGPGF